MIFHKLKYCSDIPYPIGSNPGYAFKVAKKMTAKFKELYSPDDYYAIAVRGTSGAVVGSFFMALLPEYKRMEMKIIRKPEEIHHDCEGKPKIFSESKIIIMDDFVCSGLTVNTIASAFDNREIEALIVSGRVRGCLLRFTPKIIIAGQYVDPDDED